MVLDLLFFLFSLGLPSDEYFSSLPAHRQHCWTAFVTWNIKHCVRVLKTVWWSEDIFLKNTKMKQGYTYIIFVRGTLLEYSGEGWIFFWGEGRQSMSVCIGYGLCVARPFFLFLCISRQRSLMRVRCLSLFTSSLIHRFWTQQRVSSSQQLNCHNNSGRVPLNRCIAVL